jgi:general secretion pathway protein F
MPQFRYVAVEASSETIEGRMEAPSKSAVIERLHAAGHVPIRVHEVSAASLLAVDLGDLLGRRTLSRRSLALITSQLATLLQAGLALDEALAIVEELMERARERQCLRGLRDKISGGATLADAMAADSAAFPDFCVSMVRAGEAGGSLEAVLARLAEYLERSRAAREHIKSALAYPAIVALICIGSIVVLLGFVVPRFRPLFEQAGTALPPSASALLAASDFFADDWWLVLLAVAAASLVLYWQLKNPAALKAWQRSALRLPLVGPLISRFEIVQLSRTLGTLLKNGVSLLSALAITRETTRNVVFAEAIELIAERAQTGKGLAEPMRASGVFPSLVVHLMRVGEESGRQDEMLFKLADIYEGELRQSTDRLLALVGPTLTIVMGAIVAGVIGSILTAVLSIYDLAI